MQAVPLKAVPAKYCYFPRLARIQRKKVQGHGVRLNTSVLPHQKQKLNELQGFNALIMPGGLILGAEER